MNTYKALRAASAAALVTLGTGLAACGGGDGPAGTPLPPVAAKACVNTPGDLDTVQSTLSGLLAASAERVPAVGPAAADASRALAWTVDAVDAVLASLTTLARTQDPRALTTGLGGTGDALQCATGSLSDTLAELARLSGGTPIPGLAQVQTLLAEVAGRARSGLDGQGAGAADLQRLTGLLAQLSTQLATLSTRLPVPVDQPLLRSLLDANALAFGSLANVLGDLGALRGQALVSEVSGLLRQLTLELPASLAGQAGIPASALSPLAPQLQQALQQFEAGAAVVVVPLFAALSTVLGSGLGTTAVAAPFSDLVDGALSGLPLARIDQIAALIPGGATAGAPSLLNELLGSLGGGLGGLLGGG